MDRSITVYLFYVSAGLAGSLRQKTAKLTDTEPEPLQLIARTESGRGYGSCAT